MNNWWRVLKRTRKLVRNEHQSVEFNKGDRVKHVFYSWKGTVTRPGELEGLSGFCVVWDDAQIVDHEPGEEIWYLSMALMRIR